MLNDQEVLRRLEEVLIMDKPGLLMPVPSFPKAKKVESVGDPNLFFDLELEFSLSWTRERGL
jgi:hypothetical protein